MDHGFIFRTGKIFFYKILLGKIGKNRRGNQIRNCILAEAGESNKFLESSNFSIFHFTVTTADVIQINY